ncbi:hypothetical protein Y032_0167g148 [Ancylostoma ceylanicum]|uniref:Uncharacterized protein n=1 Tax=Ancylostoma ceylanicum TaxID=53326 RepID=A0A016SWW6_9BILA|nr:hypothetical protein Y032_0167g148 [Ancylostoma ceylanicum]
MLFRQAQAPALLVVGRAELLKRTKKQRGHRTGEGQERCRSRIMKDQWKKRVRSLSARLQARDHEGVAEEARLLFTA